MARVLVHGADLAGAEISRLRVSMHGLPARTLDRAQVIAWLRDGHSFVLARSGDALQLVDCGGDDGPAWFVRQDNLKEAADRVEGAPDVSGAGV